MRRSRGIDLPLQRRAHRTMRLFGASIEERLLGLGVTAMTLASLMVACLNPDLGRDVDLIPPAVEQVVPSLAPGASLPRLAPDDVIRVRFSEPMDSWSVTSDTVLLVVGRAEEEPGCASSRVGDGGLREGDAAACADGTCAEGWCLRPGVDSAFLADANDSPLAASRASRLVPVELGMSPDGREVTVAPVTPLEAPRVYTLVLSAELHDRSGNPLGDAEGRAPGWSASFEVRIAESPSGSGQPIRLLEPSPDSQEVPPNLASIRVGLLEAVQGDLGANLWLAGPRGRVSGRLLADDASCDPGMVACYRLELLAPLQPATSYALVLGDALSDAQGNALPPASGDGFTTGQTPDTSPPELSSLALEVEGGCLTLSAQTNELAQVQGSWTSGTPGAPQSGTLGPSSLGLKHALTTPLLPLDAALFLEARDLAGNRSDPVALDLPAALPAPVAISEVLANPAGPEPAAEWVELVNLGATTVSLSGWSLTDDLARTGDLLPAVELPPGAVGLVVTAGYDSESGEDPQPAASAVIVSIEGNALGSGGLSNAGEPVWVRDEAGLVVTRYPGSPSSGERPANGQSVGRDLGVGCVGRSEWRLRSGGGSTPGWLE